LIAIVATPANALYIVEILAVVVIDVAVDVAVAVAATVVISAPTTSSPFVIVVRIDFNFNRTEVF
jgi:hypothetical protein